MGGVPFFPRLFACTFLCLLGKGLGLNNTISNRGQRLTLEITDAGKCAITCSPLPSVEFHYSSPPFYTVPRMSKCTTQLTELSGHNGDRCIFLLANIFSLRKRKTMYILQLKQLPLHRVNIPDPGDSVSIVLLSAYFI